MDFITTLKDKDIFPDIAFPPVLEWQTRKTVKVVVQREDGCIALVTNPIHGCYLLPGGGVEESEDSLMAAERECREEISHSILNPKMFALVEEYRARDGKRYETHVIMASLGEPTTEDLRTEDEKKNLLSVVWRSLKDAEVLFESQEKMLREGKVGFYNTGFNIVRDRLLIQEASKQGLL